MSLLLEIETLSRDRGIDREVLVETLESAMKTAAKKVFGELRDIEAQFNEETGDIDLFLIVVVADEIENPHRQITVAAARDNIDPYAEPGDELLFQIFYREEDLDRAREQDRRYGELLQLESSRRVFGRIAAQTAKQVIIQRLREAERENIYEEYKDRKNELITGIVRRFERGNIIVELGRADAILPSREQTRRESYRPGDRIQGYVKDVERSTREPQVKLSRSDPNLVIKLFEKEVPEIDEGIVKIVSVAREAGVRSKVAVYSSDNDVDPVGACVGMRGSRVQSVVQELRGEKIDIVPYSTDEARYVCNAISPAQVAKVFLDDNTRTMELIVPDDQLSLAIGRGGQNVRLAAQLTGWDLEILSESRLVEMMAEMRDRLVEQTGVEGAVVDTVFSIGYSKLEDIALADVAELARLPGVGEEAAQRLVDAAAVVLAADSDESDVPVTEADLEREALTRIRGVGEKVAAAMYDGGYTEPLLLVAEDDHDRLAALAGIDGKKAKQVLAAAEKWYQQANFDEDDKEEHEELFEDFRDDLSELFEKHVAAAAAAAAEEDADDADEVSEEEAAAADVAVESSDDDDAADVAEEPAEAADETAADDSDDSEEDDSAKA